METYRQLNLPQCGVVMTHERFGLIPNGSPAELVFRRIVERHKKITAFSVFSYNLLANSQDELQVTETRPLRRRDLRDHNVLRRLSNELHRKVDAGLRREATIQEFGVAIASRVAIRGGVAQIPMLDFASRSKRGATLDPLEISEMLAPYKGFLLETGDSLHFWGISLLTPVGWNRFLSYAEGNLSKDVVEPAFFEFSARKGFSGLRIHAYGKVKPTAPYVVARVG